MNSSQLNMQMVPQLQFLCKLHLRKRSEKLQLNQLILPKFNQMLLLRKLLNLNKLLKSHLLLQMPPLKVLMMANNQIKMVKVKQLKRNLPMLQLRLELLLEERKQEMRQLNSKKQEHLKEQKMFQLKQKLKQKMNLNQLKKQKKKLQPMTNQLLKNLSQLKINQLPQTLQLKTNQLNESL